MMEPIRYREHSFRPDNDPVWRKRGLKTFLPRRLLVLLAAFTPVGLVGLIVGGAAIAVGAAGTAVAANHVFEKNSGSWYDDIMEWLAAL